jgi:hypothetical protein
MHTKRPENYVQRRVDFGRIVFDKISYIKISMKKKYRNFSARNSFDKISEIKILTYDQNISDQKLKSPL